VHEKKKNPRHLGETQKKKTELRETKIQKRIVMGDRNGEASPKRGGRGKNKKKHRRCSPRKKEQGP